MGSAGEGRKPKPAAPSGLARLLLFLLVAGCATPVPLTRTLRHGETQLRYEVDATEARSQAAPLLIALVPKLGEPLKQAARRHGYVLVAPMNPGQVPSTALRTLVEDLDQDYAINRARVFLLGRAETSTRTVVMAAELADIVAAASVTDLSRDEVPETRLARGVGLLLIGPPAPNLIAWWTPQLKGTEGVELRWEAESATPLPDVFAFFERQTRPLASTKARISDH